jgi:hypothetical protein
MSIPCRQNPGAEVGPLALSCLHRRTMPEGRPAVRHVQQRTCCRRDVASDVSPASASACR